MDVALGYDEDTKASLGNIDEMYRNITHEHWVMLDKVKTLVVENPKVFKNFVMYCRFLIDEVRIRFAPKGEHRYDPFSSDNVSFADIAISAHMTIIQPQNKEFRQHNLSTYSAFSDKFKQRYGEDGLPNMVDIFLAIMGIPPMFSPITDGYLHTAWLFKDKSTDDFTMVGEHRIYYDKHVMVINLNVSLMAELRSLGMLAA